MGYNRKSKNRFGAQMIKQTTKLALYISDEEMN